MHIRHLYRQVNHEMELCFNIESAGPLTDKEISKLKFLLADGFIKETVSMRSYFQAPEKDVVELYEAFACAKKKSAKDAYKINVIILLATGWTIETISAALLISDETIRQYKHAYRKGGIKRLLTTKYVGSNCKLTKHQENILCVELDANIYLTTNQIIEYIKKPINYFSSVLLEKDKVV